LAQFLLIKYLSLALTAARSLILAAVMGPQSYGLLGTLVVVQQYLSYTALGMREGLTVRLAQPLQSLESSARIYSSALAWGLGVGCAIVAAILAMSLWYRPLGIEWLWVGLIAMLSILNEILINIHRDQGRLRKVALLELAYNIFPLACVLYLRRDISTLIVLQAMAAGLLVNVLAYVRGLSDIGLRHVDKRLIAQLLVLGIPLAIASFFSASVTSIYVLVANAMQMGNSIGLIAFANSICNIVLFGSNMVAWAATSKSMRGLAAIGSQATDIRNRRLSVFFRLATLASVLAIILSSYVFDLLLPAYRGAERYALFFCLLQASSLLLYVELNYLAVHAKSLLVALGYGAVLGITLMVYFIAPDIGLLNLVTVAIVLSAALAVLCVLYCRKLGMSAVQGLRPQMAFLAFPPLCAFAMQLMGLAGAAGVVAIYLGLALHALRASLSRSPTP
jgi:hypothetical protein